MCTSKHLGNAQQLKSVIYKIAHKNENIKECYVGSTKNLYQRTFQHKSDCNNDKSPRHKYNLYEFIRQNGNWDEWEITELEQCIYNDKKELLLRERHWTKELKANLNKNVQCRTKQEYYNDNKDIIHEKMKEFYHNNIEIIKEKKRIYYEKNKEKIILKSKQYYSNNIDKVRQYYLDNKERINAYQKQYHLYKKN